MRKCLLFFLLFSNIVIYAQFLQLEEIPKIGNASIAYYDTPFENQFYLKTRAELGITNYTVDKGEKFDKIWINGIYHYLNENVIVINDTNNGKILIYESESIEVVYDYGQDSYANLFLFDNTIYLNLNGFQILAYKEEALQFEEIFSPDIYSFRILRLLSVSQDYITVQSDQNELFFFTNEFELISTIQSPGYLIKPTINDEFFVINNSKCYYLESPFSDFISVDFSGQILPIDFNGWYYFYENETIFRISAFSEFDNKEIIKTNVTEFLEFSKNETELFYVASDSLFQIINESEINHIPLNLTSSTNNKLLIENNKLYTLSNHDIYSFQENNWIRLNDNIRDQIRNFDLNSTGQILCTTSNTGSYFSNGLNEEFRQLSSVFGHPIIPAEDTLVLGRGFCSDVGGDFSLFSTDSGNNWFQSGINYCNTIYTNGLSYIPDYKRIDNSIFFYGQTYSYGGIPQPGETAQFYSLLTIELNTFGSSEYPVFDLIPFDQGSTLITEDGTFYLHPLSSEYFVPPDSVDVPAFIGNVFDFAASFEELGPSPRGHVFEGPESGSIFVVNNQEFHSKVYYREIPTSDYEEVQLSVPELGKIKYIKYDDLGQMYIATEHSHFYKANLLASNTDEIEAIGVKLFPNPTSDVIHMEFKEPVSKIELIDIQGRKINTDIGPANLNLSILESGGIYILKIRFENGHIHSEKVVKI